MWAGENNDYEGYLRTILPLNMFSILFINKLRWLITWGSYMMISTSYIS